MQYQMWGEKKARICLQIAPQGVGAYLLANSAAGGLPPHLQKKSNSVQVYQVVQMVMDKPVQFGHVQ